MTSFDVIAPDRLGLLYELLRCIGESGFEISSARITTEKGAAMDTVHITGPEGRKITDDPALQALKHSSTQARVQSDRRRQRVTATGKGRRG